MGPRVDLVLRPKSDVKALDAETAERIGRVARAETVNIEGGSAVFGFARSAVAGDIARGNVEMAARFELGAHWHTRYELIDRSPT
jgi:hypothetical protein